MSARDGQGWLDLSGYPDLDPDAVGSPAELADLRRALAGAAAPELTEPDWAAMLDRAVQPPDLVEAARDGFDDDEAGGDAPGPAGDARDWAADEADDQPPGEPPGPAPFDEHDHLPDDDFDDPL